MYTDTSMDMSTSTAARTTAASVGEVPAPVSDPVSAGPAARVEAAASRGPGRAGAPSGPSVRAASTPVASADPAPGAGADAAVAAGVRGAVMCAPRSWPF